MSLDNVLNNLQRAERALWDSNVFQLVPHKVAEAARLTHLAISQIEVHKILESALEKLEELPEYQTKESVKEGYSLIQKAIVSLQSHRCDKYDEWKLSSDY